MVYLSKPNRYHLSHFHYFHHTESNVTHSIRCVCVRVCVAFDVFSTYFGFSQHIFFFQKL